MTAFIAILGLAIGSFLNALAYRAQNGRPIIGRSFCPHCKHQLYWWHLVPVASFFALRGRCHFCKEKISRQYPLIELLTALSFFSLAWFNGYLTRQPLLLTVNLLLVSLLIFIALYDFKTYFILDAAVISGVALSLILAFYRHTLFESALSALGFALILGSIYLISRGKWLGLGDVKLSFFLGLLAGNLSLVVLLFASWIGTFIGLGLIIFKKANLKTQMPFGTLLSAAAILVMIFERNLEELINFLFRL